MAELHTAKALVDIYILFVIRFYLNPIKGVKRSFGTIANLNPQGFWCTRLCFKFEYCFMNAVLASSIV